MPYREYAVYTSDPSLERALRFAERYGLHYEVHLNRTRILVPRNTLETQFLLECEGAVAVIEREEYYGYRGNKRS